jgi:hypothetical protein
VKDFVGVLLTGMTVEGIFVSVGGGLVLEGDCEGGVSETTGWQLAISNDPSKAGRRILAYFDIIPPCNVKILMV